jgi:hypothetical protein
MLGRYKRHLWEVLFWIIALAPPILLLLWLWWGE